MTSYALALNYLYGSIRPEPCSDNSLEAVDLDLQRLKSVGSGIRVLQGLEQEDIFLKLDADSRFYWHPRFVYEVVLDDGSSILIADAGWWGQSGGGIIKNLTGTSDLARIRIGYKKGGR